MAENKTDEKRKIKTMIQNTAFKIVGGNREVFEDDIKEFSFVIRKSDLSLFPEHHCMWHWHPEFEVSMVMEGEVTFAVPGMSTTLKKGDAIFVNTNVLHESYTIKGAECVSYSCLFRPEILVGTSSSLLEEKYILPVITDRNLQSYVMHPDKMSTIAMLKDLYEIVDLYNEESFGYEFEIRAKLSRFWCRLIEETAESRSTAPLLHEEDGNRVRRMMEYIHENYSEKISADDIAAAADIGARESARCFQRTIGMSPFDYLTDYRVRMAAIELLRTDDTILDISERCGFNSVSYFGKVFRNMMNCSPREYRTGKD